VLGGKEAFYRPLSKFRRGPPAVGARALEIEHVRLLSKTFETCGGQEILEAFYVERKTCARLCW
jgi:hypothetical protein